MANTTLSKIACPRCGGSGHFSFNLVRGTVCFKCDGAGFVMGNLKTIARNQAAKEKRQADQRAYHEKMSSVYCDIIREMNQIHNVPDVDSPLGRQTIDYAVIAATGKSIAQHRDERIRQTQEEAA